MNFVRAEGLVKTTLSKYQRVCNRVEELAQERMIASLDCLDLRFMDAYQRMRSDEKAQKATRYYETTVIRQLIKFALSRGMLVQDQ